MSADQIIAEFRALAVEERLKVAEAILSEDQSWIPESFREGMDDIRRGKTTSMEAALSDIPPVR